MLDGVRKSVGSPLSGSCEGWNVTPESTPAEEEARKDARARAAAMDRRARNGGGYTHLKAGH